MANYYYGYGSSGYGDGAGSGYSDPYSGSNQLAYSSDLSKYSSGALDPYSRKSKNAGVIGSPSIYSQASWSGMDAVGTLSGTKRSVDALYHQTIQGRYNTTGQTEGLFSTNSMFKHPRLETGSNLPIYPQRPGEKDCNHYMLTRTCKFGEACKFDHPIWVPEGGIPDWKEVALVPTSEPLPVRPGEPDCPYFMKIQNCKFGYRCKFNHPKGQVTQGVEFADPTSLPERPSEPICSFYAKTGKCKFGANCKFHHPKDLQIPSSGQNNGSVEQTESVVQNNRAGNLVPAKTFVPFTPALLHNSKGLPIRPGETDCPFYLKTGSCKYGATCRYSHPGITANFCNTMMPSSNASMQIGLFNSVANLLPSLDPLLAHASLGVSSTVYPQRPGQLECDFYMKTGQCKFRDSCKFHHPIDRLAQVALAAKQAQPNVKLTPAGFPRREGAVTCSFYMKTGTCKYGVTCIYDHPPLGEAVDMATVQGGAASAAGGEATN